MSLKHNVVADPTYGFLRVEPLPTKEEVERYYRQEFYSEKNPNFNDSAIANQTDDIERQFHEFRHRQMAEIFQGLIGDLRGKRLLDIGCGYGQALLYFRSVGMDVTGFDPSPEAAEYAKTVDINVLTGDMEHCDELISEKFDVVTLLNVLEHLRDPVSTLRKIRESILSKGGVLMIDVPNDFNPFQLAADAEYSLGTWWVSPPCHINYFTPETLRQLLERLGFEIADMVASFPLEMFLLMGEQYIGNPSLGRSCHARRVSFEQTLIRHGQEKTLLAFYRALANLGLGRQICAYAKVT